MTKKDYELVGAVIKEVWSDFFTRNEIRKEMFETLVFRLAAAFEEDNPKFDRDKFLDFIRPGR